MAQDSGKRPDFGVGVFAVPIEGKIRIVVDDLRRRAEPDPLPVWEMMAFVTHSDCETARFFAHSLSAEQYETLGRLLVARLAALRLTREEA